MVKNPLSVKGLVVAVTFLFVSVAFTPSINFNVVKAASDNKMMEVTTQASGINGFRDNTVKLTKEQYQDLQQYLIDFRERLNKTTTREEAVPIFNEAVVELNNYGLLPKGMSVEQGQKLVTGRYGEETGSMLYQRLRYVVLNNYIINYNFLCLVAGSVTKMFVVGQISLWLTYLFTMMSLGFLFVIFVAKYGEKFDYYWESWLNNHGNDTLFFIKLYTQYTLFLNLLPISIVHPIAFDENATGWFSSIGILGLRKYNGSLSGILPLAAVPYSPIPMYAAWGFTGLKITSFNTSEPSFILGFASAVGIEEK